ncbi:iron transporter [Roseibium salinum]|uniref:Iron transporter n=1 Tax=Roseibium salinum TaxID=1604349 RepID=A0ABT3QW92_9HYPH|nr:iron transporter [Roseibium sp. DSM 29163]MCX2721191.1 iron transporter [Roseibium sp. DSM 29163]MDN3722672.1 iron transporter [Roseibium salinum]
MNGQKPPASPSEEADRTQLDLAKQEGTAYFRSLEYMANKVAANGATQECGDVIVGFAQEKAEGMYRLRNQELVWEEPPQDENCHFEVTVIDATDRRFIPNLDVTLTVTDGKGNEVGSEKMPFLWHPGLYHYGRNWALPGDGRYNLVVDIETPEFPRHDKVNGRRYAKPIKAHFPSVQVKTGRG